MVADDSELVFGVFVPPVTVRVRIYEVLEGSVLGRNVHLYRLLDRLSWELLQLFSSVSILQINRFQRPTFKRVTRPNSIARNLKVQLTVHFFIDRLRYAIKVVTIEVGGALL